MEGASASPRLRTVALSSKRAPAAGLLSLAAGDSTTRSGAGAGRTVTPRSCVAVSPPRSSARTVTVAVPALSAPIVTILPDTEALATPASELWAV